MSREVRRVPVGWQHPTEPNPYWREQTLRALQRGDSLSRLHLPQVRFIGLLDNYDARVAEWESEVADAKARRGHSWTFSLKYHLTGYQGRGDEAPKVHPFYVWTDDDTEASVEVRDEDHLHELLIAQKESERPNPEHYMPAFVGPLGFCLYETVSEGTPITPTFGTSAELVDHLVEFGEDWRQEPYRREAAERLVSQGFSFGTMVVSGGRLLDSSRDADLIGGPS